MNHHIHLNLIKDEEVLSPSPVRTKSFVPIFLLIVTLCTAIWFLYVLMVNTKNKELRDKYIQTNRGLEKSYKESLELMAQEKSLEAGIAQFNLFQRSKLLYGRTIACIPEYVQTNIQFTTLDVPYPQAPLFDKQKPQSGPTNTIEKTKLVITGKTSGNNTLQAVDYLLNGLNSDAHTNLIRKAIIPKGSFKQTTKTSQLSDDVLQFTIECECGPRIFQ